MLLEITHVFDYHQAERILLKKTQLELVDCNISDLSPLASLTNLTHLWLFWNDISDLAPLKGLINLIDLDLSDNQISNITSLQRLTNLVELNLSDNKIKDITPLNELTKLTNLNLAGNQIIDIKSLSKLIFIEDLDLSNNQITDIDSLKSLINLQQLYLQENIISDLIPLKNLEKVIFLSLVDNKISNLTPLQHLKNLNQLSIANNEVSNLNPLHNLEHLFELNVSYNKITDFGSFLPFKNIEELVIYGNPINIFISPTHLNQKYRKFISIPLDYQKATEAIRVAYNYIGLKAPKVIFKSNYKSWYAEIINLLESNNLFTKKDIHHFIKEKAQGMVKVREILSQKNIHFLYDRKNDIPQKWIEDIAQVKFNDSIFIREAIRPLHETVKNIGYYLIHTSRFTQTGHSLHRTITTQNILYKIYLIETYQSLLKIPLDEKTQQWYDCLNQLFEHCGWFIPFEDVCIVCDRPSKFSLDSESRLHAEGEPAIQFADGYGLYYYRGVALPEKYGEVHPNQWQAKWLLSENNTELRRILIQAIGYNRICDELQAIQLDSFREYDLIKIDANADVEPIVLLKMICPSTGYTHVLRVPPYMESARKAITWVNWDIDPEDFAVES
ncbi:MAG: leucine-rich repeat domain-containing protein [Rivularia sp. (in: Bacteria)]|nr:leucine-rich repeat domain-containing protein [Rivularia sp. MS3]